MECKSGREREDRRPASWHYQVGRPKPTTGDVVRVQACLRDLFACVCLCMRHMTLQ